MDLNESEAALQSCSYKKCSENMQQIYSRTPCLSLILIKLLCNLIEFTLQHGCFPVNLLLIFRTPFFLEHLWRASSDKY